jgi:hypothetical protein
MIKFLVVNRKTKEVFEDGLGQDGRLMEDMGNGEYCTACLDDYYIVGQEELDD